MTKINTLELKFYPNIECYLAQMSEEERKKAKVEYVNENHAEIRIGKKGHKLVINFYEYYVDGKSVYNEISKYYWKTKSEHLEPNFSYEQIGWIGSFDEIFDWVQMKEFLLEEITTEEILQYFPLKIEIVEHIVEHHEAYKNEKYHTLYGCICGHEGCGGHGVIITKENGFYFWTFGEGENELQYKFEENQYRTAFQTALEEIRAKSKKK